MVNEGGFEMESRELKSAEQRISSRQKGFLALKQHFSKFLIECIGHGVLMPHFLVWPNAGGHKNFGPCVIH